jgi:hypothetical protein
VVRLSPEVRQWTRSRQFEKFPIDGILRSSPPDSSDITGDTKFTAHFNRPSTRIASRARRCLHRQTGRSVRRWCRRWRPRLTSPEPDEIVAATRKRNKRWSYDQSAAVLEIGVGDREYHRFRFFGASNDPDYERRSEIKREKNAAQA